MNFTSSPLRYKIDLIFIFVFFFIETIDIPISFLIQESYSHWYEFMLWKVRLGKINWLNKIT